MTREEAKKILEAYIACESKKAHFKCSDDNCDDNCPLLYEMGTVGEHNEAIYMAIQALEQITKIADIVDGTIDHFDRDDAMDMLYEIKGVIR